MPPIKLKYLSYSCGAPRPGKSRKEQNEHQIKVKDKKWKLSSQFSEPLFAARHLVWWNNLVLSQFPICALRKQAWYNTSFCEWPKDTGVMARRWPWMSQGSDKLVSLAPGSQSSSRGLKNRAGLASIIQKDGHKSAFQKICRENMCFGIVSHYCFILTAQTTLSCLITLLFLGVAHPVGALPHSHAHRAVLHSKQRAIVKERPEL